MPCRFLTPPAPCFPPCPPTPPTSPAPPARPPTHPLLPRPGGARGGNSKDAQLAALNNLLKAENNRLRDQAVLDATKIKQLQSGLAGAFPYSVRAATCEAGRRVQG